MQKDWDPTTLRVCEVCGTLWSVVVLAGCTYVVFWLNQSGWWYLLALILLSWSCKQYRSPAQIAADNEEDD